MWIWAILPVQAWLLATIVIVFTIFSGFNDTTSNVAHFAHLGGLFFGFGFIKWREWKSGEAKRDFQKKLDPVGAGGSLDRGALRRWETIAIETLHELNREEVEALLDYVRSIE